MPLHKYKHEIISALDDYAMAEAFGWSDEYIQSGLSPSRKLMYLSILKGKGMAGDN